MRDINLIVNVTSDWAIGRENSLLVTISGDLKNFRRLTTGRTVILGRKTLETFPGGRPLKNRRNIILSARPDYSVEGAETAGSLEALKPMLAEDEPVSVIGGASVYEQLLPYCSSAVVTKTELVIPADRYFPNLDEMPDWEVVETSEPMEENGVIYRFVTYRNNAPETL